MTVVMAVCRYVVVCRPLHARGYISLRRTRWSIVTAFFFSVVVNVPRLLRFVVADKHCSQLGLAAANFTDQCDCFVYTKVRQNINVVYNVIIGWCY